MDLSNVSPEPRQALTLRCPESEVFKLVDIAAKENVKVSDLTRYALHYFLVSYENHKKNDTFGLGVSGMTLADLQADPSE